MSATQRFYCFCILFLFLLSTGTQAQELYVGANYHPHDSNFQQWQKDIALMKSAGFKVVRMGHLAWDSYEPAEGRFNFGWFDTVMNLMDKAGIKVILDIAVRPAPLWLHHKYPQINVTGQDGNVEYPNHRYMVDIGDSVYQHYALRFADSLTSHYARYPALLAFGMDNEPGDGPISYSEGVRKRFILWLGQKYTNTDNLNKAWASQRWSRRIGNFDEIGLPFGGQFGGAPERFLDFRRFISDEVNAFLVKLIDRVKLNAPNALTTTNMWYYAEKKYFDYAKTAYTGKLDRGGCGFYPGGSLLSNYGIYDALFGMARIQFENTTPFWCTEFTTMTAVPGSIRKSAYATLLYGNQMVCGWTWQSMSAGEEQYLEGMTDWDGTPNRKYEEYRQIAGEFKKIEKYGFPYRNQAEIGLAFSFPSQIASYAFPQRHDAQLEASFITFISRNIDTRVVDISQSTLNYKLLIVPGVAVMDEKTASNIREYVRNGGTVVMTTASAVADERNQVFTTTQPGRLNDVFGIRIAGFEETANMNELSRAGRTGNQLKLDYNGKTVTASSPRFDLVEPRGAQVLGHITSLDKDYPVITTNKYGNGTAIYIGLPADKALLDPVIDDLIKTLSIKKGPEVPADVMARQIDARHILYLNIGRSPAEIRLKGNFKGILTGKTYADKFTLPAEGPELIEIE